MESNYIMRLSTQKTENNHPKQFSISVEDLRAGQARAISDGSYFPISRSGKAAWILESQVKI